MLQLLALQTGMALHPTMASTLTAWLLSGWSVILMVLGFGLVIFVHELGHFVMAKLTGVRVDKFAVGFGWELIGYTYGETRYSFNALPLGGYVKMLGQEDFEIDKSGEWKVRDDPRAFTNKPVGSRMLIVSAGVVMNLVFAALAFMIVFMVGLRTIPARVGHVIPGSPAHRAGLMPGDEIVTINESKMDDYSSVKYAIMLTDADKPLKMQIRRTDEPNLIDVFLEPEWSEEEKLRQIGIGSPMTLQVGGVTIESELEESREDRLRVGDFIEEVDGVKVESHLEVERLITEKRGRPVKILVRRPEDPSDPDAPTEPVECYHSARMMVLPTRDSLTQHILGLIPRTMLMDVSQGGPAEKAGLRPGDIIVKWADMWHPTAKECKESVVAKDEDGRYVYAGRDVEIVVRRQGIGQEFGVGPDRPTGTFVGYHVLKPLLDVRDDLLLAARKDPAATRDRVLEILRKHTDDPVILEEIQKDLDRNAQSGQALVRWLLGLDRESYVVRVGGTGLMGGGSPRVGVVFGMLETDRLAVADVLEIDFDDEPTPAASLKIPRGALITHFNGEPVDTWFALLDRFWQNVGTEATLTYLHEGETLSGTMRIPQSLKTALDLEPGADIVSIAGKRRARFERPDGKKIPVTLPFWGAAYQILKEHEGQTVPVIYRYAGKEISTDEKGEPLTYPVTADNRDPWAMRILYSSMLIFFPERFVLQKKNPLAAMWMGFKKTGTFIFQVYKTLEHIIFTQKVGVENISGPVGILRIGHAVAQSGVINLLYFLAFISANLAVINFLPLPIVDGGLMIFLILEKIRGRPVSLKMQVATQIIGLVLIVSIFVFVTVLDVSKWMGEG